MISSEHDLEKQLPTVQPQPHTADTMTTTQKNRRSFCRVFIGCIIDVLIEMPVLFRAWTGDPPSLWKRAVFVLFLPLISLMLFAILFLAFIFTVFFTGEVQWIAHHVMGGLEDQRKRKREKKQPLSESPAALIFRRKLETKRASENILRAGVIATTRLGVLVLVWLPINLCVHPLKEALFLGSLLWKWSVLAAVVLLLTPAILLFAFILTSAMSYTHNTYWIRGVEGSVRWLLYYASIILVWVVYFFADRKRINKTYRPIHKYIILTLICVFIGALLGLLKHIVVVWWKSKFIYTPLNNSRILVAMYHLCSLLLLLTSQDDTVKIGWIVLVKTLYLLKSEVQADNSSDNRRCPIPIDKHMTLISGKVGLLDIDEAANWLARWIDVSKDETTNPADLNSNLLKRIQEKYGGTQHINQDVLTHALCQGGELPYLDKEHADFLLNLLGLDVDNNVNATKFENWINATYKTTFVFINKLHGNFALTNILYRILTVVQVVAAFILWLFITQLATARLVVTLGSLFLGLTFVFGDTCKTFFQGAVFSFVIHPFDVGDQVEIDDSTTMEVKKIDTLTTTFFQTIKDKRRTVIYPNSSLATKTIIKLHDELDDKLVAENSGTGTEFGIQIRQG